MQFETQVPPNLIAAFNIEQRSFEREQHRIRELLQTKSTANSSKARLTTSSDLSVVRASRLERLQRITDNWQSLSATYLKLANDDRMREVFRLFHGANELTPYQWCRLFKCALDANIDWSSVRSQIGAHQQDLTELLARTEAFYSALTHHAQQNDWLFAALLAEKLIPDYAPESNNLQATNTWKAITRANRSSMRRRTRVRRAGIDVGSLFRLGPPTRVRMQGQSILLPSVNPRMPPHLVLPWVEAFSAMIRRLTSDPFLNTDQTVQAALVTRQNSAKNSFIRAFAAGLMRAGWRDSVRTRAMIAVVASITLDVETLTDDDVRAALRPLKRRRLLD